METQVLDNRIIYGKFVDGLVEGFGYVVFNNNAQTPANPCFTGIFVKGKANGLGRFDYGDGSYYEGMFENDRFNGQGIYYYCNGDVYKGEFYENMRHGQGTLTKTNGEIYEGEFEYDTYSGHAKHIFGLWEYTGMYYKGLRHGYGELVNSATGEYYKGHFLDGFAHGFGAASCCGNDKTAIKGQWANGRYLYRVFIPNRKQLSS